MVTTHRRFDTAPVVVNFTTPHRTISNYPASRASGIKQTLTQLFEANKNDPEFQRAVMAYKPSPVHRATPAPRIVGVTTAELAKMCQVPETSLVRTLRRVGINPDIRVGLRTAYSKPLAEEIASWASSMLCANTARTVAEDDRMFGCQGPPPDVRARAATSALTFQRNADAKLARILRR